MLQKQPTIIQSLSVFVGYFQYPVEGTSTHTEMAQKVYECEFLLPHIIGTEPQEVVHKVSC